MRAIDRRALAILAVVGMAGTVWGASNPWELIGWAGPGRSVEDAFELSHVVSVTGGSVSEAKVTAGGDAIVTTLPMGLEPGHYSPCDDTDPCDTDGGFEFLSGTWSTTTTGTSVGDFEQVLATGDCGLYSQLDIGRAKAHIGAYTGIDLSGNGTGSVEHAMRRANLDCCWINEHSSGCCKSGKTSLPEYGVALIGALHGYEISRSGSVTVAIDFEVTFDGEGRSDTFAGWGAGPHCTTGPTCPTASGVDDYVFSITITARAVTTSGVTEEQFAGVMTANDDETYDLLGVLDDPGFDPSTGSGSLDLSSTFTGLIDDVEIDYVVDSMTMEQLLSGDVDNDGEVCGDDRVAFMDALGSSIGDADYNVRADFDLDGDVDTDDIDYLNDIGCTADLDCDGSLTIFDQQAFGNAFDASDPVADWDGDGSFTIFDYNEFGNTYGLGCP